jgi:hypothetical protein
LRELEPKRAAPKVKSGAGVLTNWGQYNPKKEERASKAG